MKVHRSALVSEADRLNFKHPASPGVIVTVLLWLAIGVALGQGASAQEPAAAAAASLRDEMGQTMPQLLARHDGVGVAVAVVRGGAVAFADGYGLADKESGRRVTADTVFNVGSISKVVTAWGVMALVEDGLLALDEPVLSYLGDWSFAPSRFSDSTGVNVARLLSHTAGLSMYSIPGFEVPQPLPPLEDILSGDYNDSVYTPPGLPVKLVHPPGSRWAYSGGGTVLLQFLIENVTEAAFTDYMRRTVLGPLDMMNSQFGWDDSLAPVAAVPYDAGGRKHPTYRFSGTSGAGLYSTVADMARFVAAGLDGGEGSEPGRGVLSDATLEQMFIPVKLNDGEDGLHGLGYFADTGSERNPASVGHAGSNFGWNAHIIAVPDSGDGLVILTNSDNGGPLISEVICLWGARVLGTTDLFQVWESAFYGYGRAPFDASGFCLI